MRPDGAPSDEELTVAILIKPALPQPAAIAEGHLIPEPLVDAVRLWGLAINHGISPIFQQWGHPPDPPGSAMALLHQATAAPTS